MVYFNYKYSKKKVNSTSVTFSDRYYIKKRRIFSFQNSLVREKYYFVVEMPTSSRINKNTHLLLRVNNKFIIIYVRCRLNIMPASRWEPQRALALALSWAFFSEASRFSSWDCAILKICAIMPVFPDCQVRNVITLPKVIQIIQSTTSV